MRITYEFLDSSGQTINGSHIGTESSYYELTTGDRILIRYLESNPKMNAPTDALGIIRPVLSHDLLG